VRVRRVMLSAGRPRTRPGRDAIVVQPPGRWSGFVSRDRQDPDTLGEVFVLSRSDLLDQVEP
jgi:hypothetical protein